ncbi:MAG: hypothetical protein R3F54_15020 [Alphaproteobacteria bacterium]
MPTAHTDSERVQTRVSPQINEEIEARAEARGLNKAEWIRVVILAALDQDAEDGDAANSAISRLGPYLEARFEQLESRIFHENSVTLHLLFETFREAVCASTAGMSGASSLAPDDEAEADERRHALFKEAETEFRRRYAELMATLKGMRDEAKTKSRALGKPWDGSSGSSSEGH